MKKTGERVVILVDEYDKPLIDNLSNKVDNDANTASLGAFWLDTKCLNLNR